jgi:hypothetical protein
MEYIAEIKGRKFYSENLKSKDHPEGTGPDGKAL